VSKETVVPAVLISKGAKRNADQYRRITNSATLITIKM
jgi:hypothetical protein